MKLLPFDYAVRNLSRSPVRLALSIGGSALVVMLVLAAAAFVRGMDVSLRASGDGDNVILLGAGSEESVERSEVPVVTAGVVEASVPGIRSRAGVAYVSPEVHVQLPVRPVDVKGEAAGGQIMVRGVTPAAMLVHRRIRIAEGRFPASGADEVMVGSMLPATMGVAKDAVAVGKSVMIDNRAWTIVGRFAAPGTVMDAEVWAPRADLRTATKRETDSCVIVSLDAAKAEFADVAAFTKTRIDLELSAIPETEYYSQLASFFAPVKAVAWMTAGLIAMGGLLGGLNTMYAAFASRVRELGTLQSIGFRSSAITASLVQESVLATCAGGLAACVLGVVLLDGVAVRFSLGAFGLVVDAGVIVVALSAGVLLGVIGALPPAWRCLRLPIPVALKSM